MAEFDAKRALLRKPDLFRRFLPGPSEFLLSALTSNEGEIAGTRSAEGGPVAVADDDVVLVLERGGHRRGLLARQMGYHHVAQGELAGEPYLVTF